MKTVTGYFNFFPVGQGLFYGGNISLDDRSLFSFIYDCGTEKEWISYLENAVKSFKTFDKTLAEIDNGGVTFIDLSKGPS